MKHCLPPTGEKRLIVHTGMGKAGSSALQQFLHQNREKLGQTGVFCPRGGELASEKLVITFRKLRQELKNKNRVSTEIIQNVLGQHQGREHYRLVEPKTMPGVRQRYKESNSKLSGLLFGKGARGLFAPWHPEDYVIFQPEELINENSIRLFLKYLLSVR